MAAAPILMGAGAAVSAYGSIKANNDRAAAERQNANYYKTQAEYASAVGARQLSLFGIKSDEVRASQLAAYAAGGVEVTGSPLATLEQESIRKMQTIRAIQAETSNRVSLAAMKGEQANSLADQYSSFTNQFISAAPSILKGAGDIAKDRSS